MLFKVAHLQGIKAGTVSLAFRKWKKPLVNKGTQIKTVAGQIEVLDIAAVYENQLSENEALSAGYKDLTALLRTLETRGEGTIYKIQLAYHSPDPRIALRNQTALSEEELDQIRLKLERLDKYSKEGPWTRQVLEAIRDNSELRALDLAAKTGRQKDWLKGNIRKLKNLGLTISHQQGYSIAPRGKLVLDKLTNENQT